MSDARDRFIALARELEAISKEHPSAYRFRVTALALLGYGYIAAVLIGLLAIIGAIIASSIMSGHFIIWTIKILIFLLIIFVLVFKSLWVKVPAPEGIEIRRQDAPQLFALIDDMREALMVPPIHRVLLDADYNAGVVQLPRFGLFGWYRQYLVLGLPLLHALSSEQFRAVLAHEFGHLSRKHGAFNVWIWRVRETWGRLQESMTQENGQVMLFNSFLKWYGPLFMASTFVLARAEEYEADRHSAELTSRERAAEALIALHLRDTYLHQTYWSELTKELRLCETPPSDPFTRMAATLRTPMTADFTSNELEKALLRQTDYDDTHPALRDRLAALGFTDLLPADSTLARMLPSSSTVSAAEVLLGSRAEDYARQLDAEWVQNATPRWKEAYDASCQARTRLAELDALAATTPPSKEEAWEHAKLTAELGQTEAAITQLRKLLETWPAYPPAQFGLGMLLLEQGDETGIGLMNAAMHQDHDFIMPGCEQIIPFLKAHGREEEAEQYIRCGIQQYAVLEQAERDASRIASNDRYHPHNLPEEEIEALQVLLAETKHAVTAYLVRKEIPNQPKRECFVMGIEPGGFTLSEEDLTTRLLESVIKRLTTSREMLVVILRGDNKFARKKMESVENSLIYQKGKMPAGV